MNYKFTADGRKVVIVGALNAKETIVQEVFVADGTEFPAGEHFVVKTLLDVPAESYKVKEEKRAEQRVKELERERDRLSREISNFNVKLEAATAKLKWVVGLNNQELQDAVERVRAFLSGEITHILICESYKMEIEELSIDAFARYESDYGRTKFDGIRLVSLFGEWNGRLSMDWRLNRYRDGSGSDIKIFPCKSLQEAVEKAQEMIYAAKELSDNQYEFCQKYKIPIDKAKNAARIDKKVQSIKKQITAYTGDLAKLEANLSALVST